MARDDGSDLVVLLSARTGHAVDDGVLVFDVAQCERDRDEREDEDEREPEDDVEDDWVVLAGQCGQVVGILRVLRLK